MTPPIMQADADEQHSDVSPIGQEYDDVHMHAEDHTHAARHMQADAHAHADMRADDHTHATEPDQEHSHDEEDEEEELPLQDTPAIVDAPLQDPAGSTIPRSEHGSAPDWLLINATARIHTPCICPPRLTTDRCQSHARRTPCHANSWTQMHCC